MISFSTLASEEEKLSAAWEQAANDLGIRVTAPFVLEVGEVRLCYSALLHDFGVRLSRLDPVRHFRSGLLVRLSNACDVLPLDHRDLLTVMAHARGYFTVFLASYFVTYEASRYRAFLNNSLFKWCGRPDQQPSWHNVPIPKDWLAMPLQ